MRHSKSVLLSTTGDRHSKVFRKWKVINTWKKSSLEAFCNWFFKFSSAVFPLEISRSWGYLAYCKITFCPFVFPIYKIKKRKYTPFSTVQGMISLMLGKLFKICGLKVPITTLNSGAHPKPAEFAKPSSSLKVPGYWFEISLSLFQGLWHGIIQHPCC